MSLLANAKAKVASGNVKEAFKNEAGAIDLASIMVGIIVIGLIGGVIAATVFAVIPWAQDNAAKQQLDSIAAAQSSYIGLSADKGDAHFGGGALVAGTPITITANEVPAAYYTVGGEGAGATAVSETLFSGAASKLAVGKWGTGNAAHYAAAVESASGKVFYITDAKTQPTEHKTGSLATNETLVVVNAALAQ